MPSFLPLEMTYLYNETDFGKHNLGKFRDLDENPAISVKKVFETINFKIVLWYAKIYFTKIKITLKINSQQS